MRCPESRSHKREPIPTPTANAASVEDIQRIGRDLDRHGRAVKPEPGDTEDREEYAAFLPRKFHDVPGFLPGIPVDPEAGIDGARHGNFSACKVADDGDADQAGTKDSLLADSECGGDFIADGDAARDQSEDDRNIGAGLDERVAANELVFRQLLRQVGVFDRAEHRRLHAHEKQYE
jgi:hypothetical protein